MYVCAHKFFSRSFYPLVFQLSNYWILLCRVAPNELQCTSFFFEVSIIIIIIITTKFRTTKYWCFNHYVFCGGKASIKMKITL
jgi:hypothetical protein